MTMQTYRDGQGKRCQFSAHGSGQKFAFDCHAARSTDFFDECCPACLVRIVNASETALNHDANPVSDRHDLLNIR